MSEFFSSFSVINSGALAALISLLLPLAIHFFNRSRGKIILIGQIELIKQAKKLRVTELKLTEWLLLIIRLLIFLLAALILSQLVKEEAVELSDERHVYLSSEWIRQATSEDLEKLQEKHTNDRIFLFNKKFQEISITWLRNNKEDIQSDKIAVDTYLLELERRNLEANENFIYVTNQLADFSELKNSLSGNYDWFVKILPETSQEDFRAAQKMRIKVVYEASRQIDRDYVQLAFDTLQPEKKQLFDIEYLEMQKQQSSATMDNQLAEPADWIIWLGSQNIHHRVSALVDSGAYLISDLNFEENITSTASKKIAGLAKINQNLVTFFYPQNKRFSNAFQANQNGQLNQVIWQDNQGKHLLVAYPQKQGKVYTFASRFHHQWNNLVESVAFSDVLYELLMSRQRLKDQLHISSSEIESHFVSSLLTTLKQQPLNNWVILLLSFLWLLERFIVSSKNRQKRDKTNG